MFSGDQYKEIYSILTNLVRVGRVTSVDSESERARVVFDDRDETESYDLQVIVRNTKENKDHALPDIDEDVLCVFLPIGIEQGFILGSFYTDANSPPSSSKNVRKVKFSDGTTIEYDRENNKLTANVKGDIDVIATGSLSANIGENATLTIGGELNADVTGNSTIKTPKLTVDGDLDVTGKTTTVGLTSTSGMSVSGGSGASVQGDLNVNGGDIKADNISLKEHPHTDSTGGKTSPAEPA